MMNTNLNVNMDMNPLKRSRSPTDPQSFTPSDDSTPEPGKEVAVQCIAPYSENQWKPIGKPRDGMDPTSVLYAPALRPPHHLVSFIRLQPQSTKGLSLTGNNTMVFVVVEGEVVVFIRTTQFMASPGDSFYVPPNNTYNIINVGYTDAELSITQYRLHEPLSREAVGKSFGKPNGTLVKISQNF